MTNLVLPDGSSFFTMSFPLPENHWLHLPGFNDSPAPFMEESKDNRKEWQEKITKAAKYAIRSATMNGKIVDFDPDAMLQQIIVGLIGEDNVLRTSSEGPTETTCS